MNVTEQTWLKWGALALGAVGALLLIGVALASSGELEGRTWVVSELVVDGSAVAPLEGTVITAKFEDGGVSGIASCNNYFGSYTVDGDSLSFGPLGSTLMACEGPIQDQETAYLTLLSQVDAYAVDGDTLTLRSGGADIITFVEADASN
jgi:heat shock protein HslJ